MAIRNFRIGWGVTDTPSELITLFADASVANYYDTMDSPVGTPYVVPGGKTLYICAFDQYPTGAGHAFYIGYANTSVNDSASAPTTPIQVTGSYPGAVGNTRYSANIVAKIPTGKYPFIQTFTGRNIVTLYGLEV